MTKYKIASFSDLVDISKEIETRKSKEDCILIFSKGLLLEEQTQETLRHIKTNIEELDQIVVFVGEEIELEEFVILPTEQEAEDFIEMEQITRMLINE